MMVLVIFAIVVLVVINIFVAQKFEDVAKLKGYDNEIHSYAMCFWLGIIGYLYVIALPDRKKEASKNDAEYQQCS